VENDSVLKIFLGSRALHVFEKILMILLIAVRVFLLIGVVWLVMQGIKRSGRIKKGNNEDDR